MVTLFLFLVCGVLCVCLLSPARGGERREILGRWSFLGLQLKNLNEGFDTKKPRDSSFRRWFAGCLFFILTYEGIVMMVSTLNFLLKMVTEKRVHDYNASM